MNEIQLPNDPEELKALLLKMQSENDSLKQQTVELSKTIGDQTKKLEEKEQIIARLWEYLRGKKQERFNPNQVLMFEIGELETIVEETKEEEKQAKRRKKKHGRRVIPEGLPTEEILYETPEKDRACPDCGEVLPRIRYEVTKQLEYQPAKVKVLIHKQAVYACPKKHDEVKLITSPKPASSISRLLAAPGLLAQVVVSKFGDHLPGYRQEEIFSRHNINIRRSTIYDWMSTVADLAEPLYQRMKKRVLQSKVIHTDDTTVKLIDKELAGTKLSRFWVYIGDRENPYTVLDFTETRKRAGPEEFLRGYRGYLQADAYGGYDGIFLRTDGNGEQQVKEVSCWAHCRRYWYQAREQDPERAHRVLGWVSQLYKVEREIQELPEEHKKQKRQEHSLPILEAMEKWLAGEHFLPKSLSGKAATYTRNQWEALKRYLEKGFLSIDNNVAERAMKQIAIGRKNWLFVGSKQAGNRAAILMSLIASCKENQAEPWAYMKDVITQLATEPSEKELENLLPDRWLLSHPSDRWTISEQRKEEHNRTQP